MLKDFRAFIAKGNVLDLAVAVIIGAAFAKIVASLTDDIIMPIVGKIFGGLDFSSHFTAARPGPGRLSRIDDRLCRAEEGRRAGARLGRSSSPRSSASLILAFIIFLMIKAANKAMRKGADAPAGPSEVELLTEIRDELRKRG